MIDDSLGPSAEPAEAAPEESRPAPEGRTLDPAEVLFRRETGRLQMREGDGEWRDVSALRLFPLSEPERWISVVDEKQVEIGVFSDLRALEPEQRDLIEEELRRRYLAPAILEIISIRHRYDVTEWTVETDRGPAVFMMRSVQEKVKEPRPRHLILEDAEGNRYDIPDIEALDPVSRRWLDQEV
ncbi:MAG TPA: hypothetical protein DEP45_01490 [Armatimonadetes bacterium]|nr:hypothetical protein [Armatimonadota bacterium]